MTKSKFHKAIKKMFPKVSANAAIHRFANRYGYKPKTVEAWCYGYNPVPIHAVNRFQHQDE